MCRFRRSISVILTKFVNAYRVESRLSSAHPPDERFESCSLVHLSEDKSVDSDTDLALAFPFAHVDVGEDWVVKHLPCCGQGASETNLTLVHSSKILLGYVIEFSLLAPNRIRVSSSIHHIHLFPLSRPRTRADDSIYSAGYAGYFFTLLVVA